MRGILNLGAPLRARPERRLESRAREQDVGADREPEGVIADNRYLDEDADDRKDHHHE
jgi:hypothetical protein